VVCILVFCWLKCVVGVVVTFCFVFGYFGFLLFVVARKVVVFFFFNSVVFFVLGSFGLSVLFVVCLVLFTSLCCLLLLLLLLFLVWLVVVIWQAYGYFCNHCSEYATLFVCYFVQLLFCCS